MRILALISLIALLPFVAIALSAAQAPRANACTGGGYRFEDAVRQADLIFIGRVIDVGDAINHAPTFVPTATATTTPLGRTPETTPVSPPVATHPTFPVPSIDLVGIRAVFQVDSVYAGEPGREYVEGEAYRSRIEFDLRDAEANGYRLSDCPFDAFVPRYTLGGRYLVFIRRGEFDFAWLAFRIEGDEAVSTDTGLLPAFGTLSVERSIYYSFFQGIPADLTETSALITAPSVPLASILRAVAYLRNDPRIYPPDTGSAGLRMRSDGWRRHVARTNSTTCGIGPEPIEQAISGAERIVLATALTVGTSGFETSTPAGAVLPDADLSGVGGTFRVERVYKGSAAEVIEVDMVQRRSAEAALRDLLAHPGTSPPCGLAAGAARYVQGDRYLLLLDDERALGAMALRVTTNARGVEVIDGRYGSGVWMMPATFLRLLPDFSPPADAYPVNTGNYTQPDIDLAAMERLVGEILGRIYPPDTGSAGLLPPP